MIKVKTNTTKTPQLYPRLMKSNICDMVIFFLRSGSGIVLVPDGIYKLGEKFDAFNMDLFEDYNEPLTIQNIR